MARISEAILLFLLNAAWQAALVAILASAGDRLLRRAAARYRHALWVTAFATCIALALGVSLRLSPVSAWLRSQGSPSANRQSRQTPTVTPPLDRSESTANLIASAKEQRLVMRPIVGLSLPVALAIVSLYSILLLYRLAMLMRAWIRTRTLLASARMAELPDEAVQAMASCRRAFALGQVAILSSPDVAVPVTAGIFHPAVILPERLLHDRDIQLLTSALGHETAHIARRDYLLNLVYEFASLPLWFHPAIRLVLLRIRQTRELRCDELVAQRLLKPVIYAKSLVQLAGAALPFGRPAATVTVGIADADLLEERIMSILKYSPAKMGSRSVLLFITALLFVVPCIALTPLAVRVTIRQPAVAAVPDQAGAQTLAPASPSSQIPARATETVKILTPEGEVTVTTNHRPKVGDVVRVDGRRLRIIAMDQNGQYHGSLFKDANSLANLAVLSDLSAQVQEARQNLERAERAAAEKHEGEMSAQELKAQRQQLREARQNMERAQRAMAEIEEGELSPQELEVRRQEEAAVRAERAQRQLELARQAKITMDQAIRIAQGQAPGTVVEARLIGERSTVTYLISILQENANGSETVHVLVNAVDGSILETGTRK